jgi:hypothetical protein
MEKLDLAKLMNATGAAPKQSKASIALTERLRCAGILEAPEAQGRLKLAQELAFRSSADVATARALLAASPQEDQFGLALIREANGLGNMSAENLGDERAARLAELRTVRQDRK